jgi:hypothetical protein
MGRNRGKYERTFGIFLVIAHFMVFDFVPSKQQLGSDGVYQDKRKA